MPAGFPIDDDATGVKDGDLIMLSNGNGNAIQEVTSVVGPVDHLLVDGGVEPQPAHAPKGSVRCELRNADGTGRRRR